MCKLVICLPLPLPRENSLSELNGMWRPIWQVIVDKNGGEKKIDFFLPFTPAPACILLKVMGTLKIVVIKI